MIRVYVLSLFRNPRYLELLLVHHHIREFDRNVQRVFDLEQGILEPLLGFRIPLVEVEESLLHVGQRVQDLVVAESGFGGLGVLYGVLDGFGVGEFDCAPNKLVFPCSGADFYDGDWVLQGLARDALVGGHYGDNLNGLDFANELYLRDANRLIQSIRDVQISFQRKFFGGKNTNINGLNEKSLTTRNNHFDILQLQIVKIMNEQLSHFILHIDLYRCPFPQFYLRESVLCGFLPFPTQSISRREDVNIYVIIGRVTKHNTFPRVRIPRLNSNPRCVFEPIVRDLGHYFLAPEPLLNKLPTIRIFQIYHKEDAELEHSIPHLLEIHLEIKRIFRFSINTKRKFPVLHPLDLWDIYVDLLHAKYQRGAWVHHGDLELPLCQKLVILDNHPVFIKDLNWCLLIPQKWLIGIADLSDQEIAVDELIPLQGEALENPEFVVHKVVDREGGVTQRG